MHRGIHTYCQGACVRILIPWFVHAIWCSVASWREQWEYAALTTLPPPHHLLPTGLDWRSLCLVQNAKPIYAMMDQILSSSVGKHKCPALPYCALIIHPLFKPFQFLCNPPLPIYICIATQWLCIHLHPASPHFPLPTLLPLANSPCHCLPVNLFMFDHFHWHLKSSHRFHSGKRLRGSSLKKFKSTI